MKKILLVFLILSQVYMPIRQLLTEVELIKYEKTLDDNYELEFKSTCSNEANAITKPLKYLVQDFAIIFYESKIAIRIVKRVVIDNSLYLLFCTFRI